MNNYIKSPFKYTGRKISILDQILPYFPDLKEHKTFIDVFAGSGDVSINIPEGIDIIWNDIQEPLIDCFKELSERDNDIEFDFSRKIKLLKQSIQEFDNKSDFYYSLRERYNDLPNACDLLMLSYYSFSNMIRFNNKNKFNSPYGNRSLNKEDFLILDKFVETLKSKHIYFCSFEFDVLIDRIINNYSESEIKPFLYLDPPYLITSAPYSRCWSETKEQLLYNKLSELTDKGFKWALSNVLEHNGKVNDTLSWFLSIESDITKVIEIDKNYNNSYGTKKRNNNITKEILVLNY